MTDLHLFLSNFDIFCYTFLSSIVSIIINYILESKKLKEAIISGFFTLAISLPLLEYFKEIPPSTALIIGCVVGGIGSKGVLEIFYTIKDFVSMFAEAKLGYMDNRYRSHNPYPRTREPYTIVRNKNTSNNSEPPMPEDLR